MAKKTESYYGWWISSYDGRLSSYDVGSTGRAPRKVKVGVTMTARRYDPILRKMRAARQPEIAPCSTGMHAAPSPAAASRYRRISLFSTHTEQVLCRVRLDGVIPLSKYDFDQNKRVGLKRTVLFALPANLFHSRNYGRAVGNRAARKVFADAGYDFSTEK